MGKDTFKIRNLKTSALVFVGCMFGSTVLGPTLFPYVESKPEYIESREQIDFTYNAKRDSMENASRFQLDSLKNGYQAQLDSLESKFE